MQVVHGTSQKYVTLWVSAAEACASTAHLSGGVLSVATAGFSATFTIQVMKDSADVWLDLLFFLTG